MVQKFVQMLFKRNSAPDWFYLDKKNKVTEQEIKAKIRNEIYNEVESKKYDRRIWTEEFIDKVATLFYRFFNQLYRQSS